MYRMKKKTNSKKTIISLCLTMAVFILSSCTSQGDNISGENCTPADVEKSGDFESAEVSEGAHETKVTDSVEKSENSTFYADISFEGGSGKAYIKSPVEVTRTDEGLFAKFVWSSKNYDYMIVDGVKYDNENEGGESTFTVPVSGVTGELTVIGDTVAMSTPHEIEYRIIWGEQKREENEDDVMYVSSGESDHDAVRRALEMAGLSQTDSYSLKYAKCFEIEKYGDYTYIPIQNSGDYLVVPKGADIPGGLPEDVTVLKKPLDKTYLVSTSAMDLISSCGAISMVALSGTKKGDWYIDEARDAMERGEIIYAGKYSAPDYELILGSGCNLAIENTMIYHEPAVKQKLEELGIPVVVETSSYEEHPLGRLEWIRFYGELFDKEKEAEEFFEDQLEIIENIMKEKEEQKRKVVFFHVTANGNINVRRPGDYITRMLELSGGEYVIESLGDDDSRQASTNMQMEDFYREARDADIIIYNSTIDGEITSKSELIAKNELFADFKAVKEDKVYCTRRELFQKMTGMAEFMSDLKDVFDDKDRNYTYLYKLN